MSERELRYWLRLYDEHQPANLDWEDDLLELDDLLSEAAHALRAHKADDIPVALQKIAPLFTQPGAIQIDLPRGRWMIVSAYSN